MDENEAKNKYRNGSKNGKAKIWLYAVVLFTSAFIVLLLTAYSQIRLNKNLSNYKDRIFSTESEKNKYQLNFTSAQETNNKLKEEIEKLKEEKKQIIENYNKSEKEKAQIEQNYSKVIQEYDKLSEAQTMFLNENYTVSALILIKEIDISHLNEKAKEAYKLLLEKARPKAGNFLYQEGYALYKKKSYPDAIQKFVQCLEIAPAEEFSDSCLYYLALAEYKSGNTDKSVEYIGILISTFPDSTYIKKAKYFYEEHYKH